MVTNENKGKILASFSFFFLFLAIIAQQIQSPPSGPWNGIYTQYLEYWGLVFLASVLLIVSVQLFDISWEIVFAFSVLFTFTVISQSYLWMEPWGWRDPWRHLGDILDQNLSPTKNVYPLFHSLVITISTLIGIEARIVLSKVLLLTSVFGILLLIIVIKLSGTATTAQQTAVLIILPSLFLDFRPRPFTLAYPFLLIGFWLSIRKSRDLKTIGAVLLLPLVLIHPFIATLATSIIILSFGLSTIVDIDGVYGLRPKIGGYILLAVAVEVTFLIFVVTGFSNQLITAVGEVLFQTSGTVGSSGPAGTELISEAFSSNDKFIEFLLRMSFILALSLVSLIGVINQVRFYNITPNILVGTTFGISVLLLFLIIGFIPAGIGITRLLILSPILFAPILPYAFRDYTTNTKPVSIVLAILVLSSGLLTGFAWPGIGGIEYSATEPQVTGINWVVNETTGDIVGTSMSHWIIIGQFGWQMSVKLSPTTANGMITTKVRAGEYSWEVSNRPQNTLYLIDGAERARAQQFARESTRYPILCLDSFEKNQHQIYDNNDTKAFIISKKPVCGITP